MSEESPTLAAGGQLWEVVGGQQTDGIKVRKDADLKSDEASPPRLAFGSKVKEIGKSGMHLNFVLESGHGPKTGWVTLRLREKELLRPVICREQTVNQPNETDFHEFKALAAQSGSMSDARFWDTVLTQQILVPNLHSDNLVEVVGPQSHVYKGKVGKLQCQVPDNGSTGDGCKWVERFEDDGKEIAVLRQHLVPWHRDAEELRRFEDQRCEQEPREEEECQKEEERQKEKQLEIGRRREEMNKRRLEELCRKEEEGKRKEYEARQKEEQENDMTEEVHRREVGRRRREEGEQSQQDMQPQKAEQEMGQRRAQQDCEVRRQEVVLRKQKEDERQREKEQRRELVRRSVEQAKHRQKERQRLEEQRKLKDRCKKEEGQQAAQCLEEHRRLEAERLDVARSYAETVSKAFEPLQVLRQRVEAPEQEVATDVTYAKMLKALGPVQALRQRDEALRQRKEARGMVCRYAEKEKWINDQMQFLKQQYDALREQYETPNL